MWDTTNRLVEVDQVVSGVQTTLAQYTYDVFNNPIKVIEGGSTRYTLYDGQTPVLDFDASSTVTARYLNGPAIDEVLARETTGGTVAWYITDRLGTVRDLVNNSGTVIDHVDYSGYGTVLSESAPSTGDRFKYAGMELDSTTGLYYDRARWYDSVGGKFVGQDPIGFATGDSNLYRYVGNSPATWIDPTGLILEDPGSKKSPSDILVGALKDTDVREAMRKDYMAAQEENKNIANSSKRLERGGFILFNPKTGDYVVSHKGVNRLRRRPLGTHFSPSGPKKYPKNGFPKPTDPYIDDEGNPLPGYEVIGTYHTHPNNAHPSPADYEGLWKKKPGILVCPNGDLGVCEYEIEAPPPTGQHEAVGPERY